MTIKLEIQERGTMLSDYFCGTSGVMLPLNIDKETTCKEVLETLKEEIDLVWDHVEHTAEHHGFPLEDLDFAINAQLAKMNTYASQGKMDKPYNGDLDFTWESVGFEELDLPVAIFTIEFIKEVMVEKENEECIECGSKNIDTRQESSRLLCVDCETAFREEHCGGNQCE